MHMGLSATTCGLLQYFSSIYLKKIMKNFVQDSQYCQTQTTYPHNFSQMHYCCGNSINQSDRKFNTCVTAKCLTKETSYLILQSVDKIYSYLLTDCNSIRQPIWMSA